MNELNRQAHWQKVYKDKGEKQVSWFQEKPAISLELIDGVGAKSNSAIIDIGGGASRLVDVLVSEGYRDLFCSACSSASNLDPAAGVVHAAASAWSRSAMMSSLSSIPIDSLTTSGPAPAWIFCASVNWRCVVEAGWIISERVSPILARCENNFTLVTRFTPAS